jgi:ribosomal protein L37AE/L43A
MIDVEQAHFDSVVLFKHKCCYCGRWIRKRRWEEVGICRKCEGNVREAVTEYISESWEL